MIQFFPSSRIHRVVSRPCHRQILLHPGTMAYISSQRKQKMNLDSRRSDTKGLRMPPGLVSSFLYEGLHSSWLHHVLFEQSHSPKAQKYEWWCIQGSILDPLFFFSTGGGCIHFHFVFLFRIRFRTCLFAWTSSFAMNFFSEIFLFNCRGCIHVHFVFLFCTRFHACLFAWTSSFAMNFFSVIFQLGCWCSMISNRLPRRHNVSIQSWEKIGSFNECTRKHLFHKYWSVTSVLHDTQAQLRKIVLCKVPHLLGSELQRVFFKSFTR